MYIDRFGNILTKKVDICLDVLTICGLVDNNDIPFTRDLGIQQNISKTTQKDNIEFLNVVISNLIASNQYLSGCSISEIYFKDNKFIARIRVDDSEVELELGGYG